MTYITLIVGIAGASSLITVAWMVNAALSSVEHLG